MKVFLAALVWLVLAASPASSGSMLLTGVGPPPAVASSFQGPGDIVSGATIWGSCARVYQASLASTATSLCDLKDKTTGTVAICTLRGSSTGFVDLAGSYCAGSATPAVACAAAAGGSCVVSKIYNQITPGTLDFTQATLGNMPALTFSALNGLPGLTSTNAASTNIQTAATTQAPPYSVSSVWIRTSGTANSTGACGGNLGGFLGNPAVASTVFFQGPTGAAQVGSIADNSYHAVQGVSAAGAGNSFVTPDGVDTSGTTSGTISAVSIRIARNGLSLDGTIMECGLWPSAFTAGNRTSLNTNQHGANGYNF